MNIPTVISLPLFIEEHSGISRCEEPVTVGVPLPQGAVFDPADLRLVNQHDYAQPLQAQVLARWFDGSAQWVLLDFQISVAAHGQTALQLHHMPELTANWPCQSVTFQQSAAAVVIDTGAAVFFLNPHVCKPFDGVVTQGTDLLVAGGSQIVLTDDAGHVYEPHIHHVMVEAAGPLRVTLNMQGEMRATSRAVLAHFIARMSFYAGSSLVELQLTLHNPRAAHHLGGLWDLGDKGSIYFTDLSFHIPLLTQHESCSAWATQPRQPMAAQTCTHLEIYQDSSGGANWQSTNHVNRFGKVMHTFQGYCVTADGNVLEEGKRATPVLALHSAGRHVAATIDKFWQNFPKALEVHHNQLTLRLFPQQYNDVYELQGGEQKRHTIYLQFTASGHQPGEMHWVHDRLVPRTPPTWYASSKTFSYLIPRSQQESAEYLALVETVINGPDAFAARREIIDEYGWRHFGDLYADHEAVRHAGEEPLVTHYNNQYDVIYGALVHYASSGDRRWFDLARDLAQHVTDIDIYHTKEDRPAYNGGLFWHTDHYVDAATATHRTYSRVNQGMQHSQSYGGGPSNEHNYTSGLLYYYFLTGDPAAREAVQGLAEWVINMDDGLQRRLGRFDRRPTGLCSATVDRDYHGPGRGGGNSINALLDAYLLTHERHYLAKAEQLICRCIHPSDDIATRQLDDVEHRWSYTVFLQVLGKYLEVKASKGDLNYMYSYAQASLHHYAVWMLEHEVPYISVLDQVDMPTETWPAQDGRKSHVFHLAAKHAAEPLRSTFRQQAAFFFQTCIRDVQTFTTWKLSRPLILLMTNAYIHAYFQQHPEETAPQAPQAYDFGQPQVFTPQFAELYRAREHVGNCMRVMQVLWRHLASRMRPRHLEDKHG